MSGSAGMGGGGAPVNNVGGGNIAGVGVGPQGEPGVDLKKKRTPFLFKTIEKRKKPVTEETITEETFAGHTVFAVDTDRFYACKLGKRKYARWVNYVGDDEVGKRIRAFGYKYPSKPIILKNASTGAMLYLRYPQSHRHF
jgi:hypothetical protein